MTKTDSYIEVQIMSRNQRIAGFLVASEAQFFFSDPWRFDIDKVTLGDATLRHLDLFCGDLTVVWSIDLSDWVDVPCYVSKQKIDQIFYGLVKQLDYGHLQPSEGKMNIEIETLDADELFDTIHMIYISLKELTHQAVREATRQYFEGELETLAAA